ncbi:MAG: hypothetical protein H0T14_05060 [Nocardioidaceae bacterium]|nr:hypothetical protein [Nocardioidaceae bacterium]
MLLAHATAPAGVSDVVLVGAMALHAGFQLVVTLVVYPGFAEISDQRWVAAHAAHSRRIVPLVAIVYAAVVAAAALALTDQTEPLELAAAVAAAGAVASTASVAAPAHRRMAGGRSDVSLRLLAAGRPLRPGSGGTDSCGRRRLTVTMGRTASAQRLPASSVPGG